MSDIKEGFTRVTSVFEPYTNFDAIDPVVLHRAANRGTRVHRYCELHMLGEYYPQPEEELVGYIDSFIQWYDKIVEKLICTEQRIYNNQYKLTGAIDIVAILKGDKSPTIIDIKTPASESKTWCLQTAAYRLLYNSKMDVKLHADRRIALRLDKKGGYPKIHEYTENGRDLRLYLSALEVYKYFKYGRGDE